MLGREEFCGLSRSAKRFVQEVHERWRDELRTQKNRAPLNQRRVERDLRLQQL
jgi:hypothetical protein